MTVSRLIYEVNLTTFQVTLIEGDTQMNGTVQLNSEYNTAHLLPLFSLLPWRYCFLITCLVHHPSTDANWLWQRP